MNTAMKYLKDVVTLNLDSTRCTGCGRCFEVCPHSVFTLREGKAVIADRDACMECGACSRNCAFEALSVAAGVGCAAGIIRGALKGGPPECGCDSGNCC
jgi:NAD-dependent dihydropyrimidine dehydrogenase PreA subunit